jgi:hypothetical protein
VSGMVGSELVRRSCLSPSLLFFGLVTAGRLSMVVDVDVAHFVKGILPIPFVFVSIHSAEEKIIPSRIHIDSGQSGCISQWYVRAFLID